jgi:hypothetical protein
VAALGECVNVCVGTSLNCIQNVGQQTIQPIFLCQHAATVTCHKAAMRLFHNMVEV